MRIFATTGSRSFPFDRLVRALDETELASALPGGADVFVQTGSSGYIPRTIEWKDFLSREEFGRRMDEADLVVTHGGTGAIIGAISRGKRVVAVPRLAEYGEAVDDHQVELVRQFEEMGLIKGCFNLDKIVGDIAEAVRTKFIPYRSNTAVVLESIDEFILEEVINQKGGER